MVALVLPLHSLIYGDFDRFFSITDFLTSETHQPTHLLLWMRVNLKSVINWDDSLEEFSLFAALNYLYEEFLLELIAQL